MKSTIKLPLYNIEIELEYEDYKPVCGAITGSDLIDDDMINDDGQVTDEVGCALSAIESTILAHAVAGIDVLSPQYLEGIETSVDAVLNNMGE